jgi:hypothetical protein
MSSHTTRIPTPQAIPTHRAPANRWRVWLILAGISVGWKLFVFTVGAAVPRWLITDGIAQLPAPLQEYGREAKRTALTLWDGPLERHGLVRTVRVMSVHLSDTLDAGSPTAASATAPTTAATAAALPAASGACDGHGAVVRAYTYFGIPYSEARTRCDSGVVEYRVFRRRKADPTP